MGKYRRISGNLHNRPLTERRLIDSVGVLVLKYGFKDLGKRLSLNAIAKEADVSKVLIHRYFGSKEELIEKYIHEKDYWMSIKEQMTALLKETTKKSALIEVITYVLQKQLDYFYKEEEMQQLILWEITEKSDMMNSVGNTREMLGAEFFALTERHFKNSGVNFQAVAALMVSGIYQLVLHGKKNKSLQCGIDINTKEGRCQIKEAIRQIVQWAFAAGKTKYVREMT